MAPAADRRRVDAGEGEARALAEDDPGDGATFAVVDDCGHDLTLEQPRVTAARVTALLDAQAEHR